jgi:hypothetical protein
VRPLRQRDQPVLPGLVAARRLQALGGLDRKPVGHRVEQLLLVLDVPIERRRLHAQLLGQHTHGQAVEPDLVEDLQRASGDHVPVQFHG